MKQIPQVFGRQEWEQFLGKFTLQQLLGIQLLVAQRLLELVEEQSHARKAKGAKP